MDILRLLLLSAIDSQTRTVLVSRQRTTSESNMTQLIHLGRFNIKTVRKYPQDDNFILSRLQQLEFELPPPLQHHNLEQL